MLSSQIPAKFRVPFGAAAGTTYIRPIPYTQGTPGNGAASLESAFPPETFTPPGGGGFAPDGRDFNGLLNQISAWNQWQAAGGSAPWDATFSTQIGGYPQGAVVASAVTLGLFWLSLVDNNVTNPDTGGAGWIQYPTGSPALQGARKNLLVINDGSNPTTKFNITADELALEDSIGNTFRLKTVSVSVNSAVSGAGGLDTGTLAANTGYFAWVIAQPLGGNPTGLMSLSATSPTMPSGYTLAARVSGAQITDPSKNFFRVRQVNAKAQYQVTAGSSNTAALRLLATGPAGSPGTPTWVGLPVMAASPTPFVPSTASVIKMLVTNVVDQAIVAPNNSYGPSASLTNPPPVYHDAFTVSYWPFEFVLESGDVYWANDSGANLWVMGWDDNL